jgi:hypothetical protein
MRSIVDAWIANMNDGRKEMMASQEMVEAHLEYEVPTSVNMEPEAEHQEVPREDAVVKPVEGWRKQHRAWNMAAECRQKPRERTWGYCGSQKKSDHCHQEDDLTRRQMQRGAPEGQMFKN